MIDIPCVIFAGGKSSRMGEDKALLPFDNFKTLTEFQLSRLQKIFNNVYISCKDKNKFDFDANFIEDVKTDDVYAPTAGFVAMFKALHVECIFVLSVDSPFVSEDIIKQIINEDTLHVELQASVARTPLGIQPMCGLYHRSLEPHFLKMLKEDNHKLGYLLKTSTTLHVDFEDEKPFLNLNHPQDYKEALNIIKN